MSGKRAKGSTQLEAKAHGVAARNADVGGQDRQHGDGAGLDFTVRMTLRPQPHESAGFGRADFAQGCRYGRPERR